MSDNQNINFVNSVLKDAFNGDGASLREMFDERLLHQRLSLSQVATNIDIDSKLLEKIIDGQVSIFDTLALPKIAAFLDVPVETVARKFFSMIQLSRADELRSAFDRTQMLHNFDLSVLKKMKFIDSIKDVEYAENRIRYFFDFDSVSEFHSDLVPVAYSSGARASKSEFARLFWLRTVQKTLDGTPNPYQYDRERLLNYIPSIRWHSTDVHNGLFQVVRSLFKLGVTVTYVPSISGAHVRGATLAHRGKPCIAITDYTIYYPTLWFTLMHEIYHLLFDWEVISNEKCHISQDDEYFVESEQEANEFAREFFVSEKDMHEYAMLMDDRYSVKALAQRNSVHESFYHVFHAYDTSKQDPSVWRRIKRYLPNVHDALSPLFPFTWDGVHNIPEVNKNRNQTIYNI